MLTQKCSDLTFFWIVIKVLEIFPKNITDDKKDSFPMAKAKTMSPKIDYDEINKLIKFMEEKDLSHFELEVEGLKVRITRGAPPLVSAEPAVSSQPSSEPVEKESSSPLEAPPEAKGSNLHYITSPMVGTFYRAPDPSSSPFVEIGDEVKKNQTLCIIEAMKLMNEIESDVDGVLTEIYVTNGKPVEYGQKLFAIQLLS